MKLASTSLLKRSSFFSGIQIFNSKKGKNKKISESNNSVNQKNTPKDNKKIRRGINMTDEQKDIAQKIKEDILNLYKDGFSIRMIANHYNDLYSIRNSQGHIMKEAISRETIRKILNNEEVSLKSIIGNPNFLNY